MDIQEATKIVMSRIQSLDHENATKIMGYILIQDQGEKEMVRLAFVADTLLLSYINQAKLCLGLTNSNNPSSNPSTPHSNHSSFTQTTSSPRIMIPNNGFHLPKPSSPFSRTSPRQPISYASVLNGSSSGLESSNFSGPGSPSLQFYGGNEFKGEFLGENSGGKSGHAAFFDDSVVDPIVSPSGRSDSLIFPYGGEDMGNLSSPHPHHSFHRRSCSVNDAALLSGFEDNFGFGFRPCMYFARGNCRNGSACKFSHSDFFSEGIESVGSPQKTGSGFDELLRVKALQQRLALMSSSGGHSPFSYNKLSFLDGNHRNDFSPMGLNGASSSSARQIYLTFPADSTFKEEDVSNYFSMFGPVQDVRIPYQQKRMFGFVTFVYPETVKLILAKGNPHFVCDSRVLVKPYKEKGKILEKKHLQHHQHHLEKGDYSAALSQSGFDSRELYDLPVGPRMLLNSQEMILRRKFEQEMELQHAIELQNRKMMNLQLIDLNNQQNNFHFPAGLPTGFPASSPRQSPFLMGENVFASSDANQDGSQELEAGEDASKSFAVQADDSKSPLEEVEYTTNHVESGNKQHANDGDSCLLDSFEHALPDNLFASPTKSAAEHQSSFLHASNDSNNSELKTNTSANANTSVISGSSPLTWSLLHVTSK